MTEQSRMLVRKALSQLSSSQEARHYLKEFSDIGASRFAVVKIGGGILENQLDEVAAALAFVFHLGLTPIILHGAGPQIDRALSEAGLSGERVDELRVTTAEMMAVIRPVIYALNQKLVEALSGHGVRAQGIQHGVFNCNLLDEQRYGLVGDIQSVHVDGVRSVIRTGCLPVLTCLGESASGQVLNINADIAARELVWLVRPHKVIFLTPTGGLLDQHQQIIPSISIRDQMQTLLQQDWVHSGMKLKLQQIARMLEPLDASSSVSITSVDQLARELFTHKGAGTLIAKGELIESYDSIDNTLQSQLKQILESSFGRGLRPDYFASLRLEKLYMSESRRAVAVITRGFNGLPYLNKFAVTPEGQGEGLGATLWRVIREDCSTLYWRSRSNNPINSWYYKRANVTCRKNGWIAFFCGSDLDQAVSCLGDAFEQSDSWLEKAS